MTLASELSRRGGPRLGPAFASASGSVKALAKGASQNERERLMETRKFKVQLIITNGGKWPYVGNAYVNRNGTINVYLDEGVTLSGGQKLHLRPARGKAEAPTDAPEAAE
jgi:hypothetical protein